MRIAHGVGDLGTGARGALVVGSWSAAFLDASCDEADLILAVANWPVATGPTNNLDLLQKRALVPALSDLCNLAVAVEGYDVELSSRRVSTLLKSNEGEVWVTDNSKVDLAIGNVVIFQTREIGTSGNEEFEGGVDF